MKKTMVYLPEAIHDGLRRLAFEEKSSMAELIRRAVELVYSEDIEDIRDMEEELARCIASAREEEATISILVGRECQALQPLSTIADNCCGSLPKGHNCIEIILGREKARELQENRSTVMTPAWIEMINNSIAAGHWTVEDARINLGRYDRILLLDSGLEQLDDEMIMEFFELTRVPIEIVPISLDHFREVVATLLAEP